MQSGRTQRLNNKLVSAFNQACDLDNLEVACSLIVILDDMFGKSSPVTLDRRKAILTIVAAHERLWLLTHGHRST